MKAAQLKKIILTILTGFVIFYIAVTGANLLIKLTTVYQPVCNPIFCQEVSSDSADCLIQTPGFNQCVNIEGKFYILSTTLAYMLLGLSLIFAFYLSQQFFISRFLIFFSIVALSIISLRILIGAIELSTSGITDELYKTGLYHPVFKEASAMLFEMFNPRF